MTTTITKKTRMAKRGGAGSKTALQVRVVGKSKGRGSEDETEYLLKSPANAEHLRQALADLDAGKGIEVSLEDL